MFLTAAPFKWTFPWPQWLSELRNQTGRGPAEVAIPETLHMAHVLQQIIRRFLCGKNTNRWRNHVFASNSDRSVNNVRNYFYRYEFQKGEHCSHSGLFGGSVRT